MEKYIRVSKTLPILRIIKVCSLITIFCFTLQVIAADKKNSITSSQDVPSDQPSQLGAPGSDGIPEQQEETVEEITIIGQKQIFDIRKKILKAEDRVFGLFNELNEDDEYDIQCKVEAPIGSNIKRRMCLPNFYHRATADNASEFINLIYGYSNFSTPSSPARLVFAIRNEVLQKKLRELARKNPELLDALRENYELNEELEKTRNSYHGLTGE